ncbi:5-formyltetrahydrofolate cyclo-ligase [Purpureocillium takamizusanense]|uniref:5-formyltetrahydrofolate cyclo-ligase n=1 Tax=Purpureocillium takamizusanense TaxID=2060973 RepID=A0A9Q8Q5S6_9HYPO|nr:5-formyltetrahydrofolate cyclo-ligase [Purpureocillium takamizusanense]UNI13525.1 5-formyltetrahydrofolate cyclo-ligase [Purpureocillium takamizusanense]
MAAASVATAKQQLRSLMKRRLSSVTPESVTVQSRHIFESLKDFEPYRNAARISIYLSMPAAEVQTDAIVRHALAAGKHVFVPYLHRPPVEMSDAPARVMDMVHLKSVQDYESLTRDRWGIPSIDLATVHERQRILGGTETQTSDDDDDAAATLDLMLMPGVAFDFDDAGSVRRLGHGKGFYDFFLNRYLAQQHSSPERPPLRLYGLALTEQLLAPGSGDEVPTGAHDRRLHGLVLGSGEIRHSSTSSV